MKNLKSIQKKSLEILIEFDLFCKKEKIDYSLFYGSHLGAYRHQGFIPWDDDIDLVMTRENFNKFKSISTKLPNDLLFIDSKPGIPIPPKIVSQNEKVKTRDGIDRVFIDIFPLDFLTKKQKEKLDLCDALQQVWEYRKTIRTQSFLHYVFYHFISNPIHKIEQKIRKETISEIKENGKIELQYVTYIWENNITNKACAWKDITPFKQGLFEGFILPIPNKDDPVLRTLYGDDYMTPIEVKGHFSEENNSK